MIKFKIKFPAGYQIKSIYNDNLDMHIILSDNRVFFATIFTIENIKKLMIGESYFWADSMLILSDLSEETIKQSVADIIQNGNIDSVLAKIGIIQEIYGIDYTFENIKDAWA